MTNESYSGDPVYTDADIEQLHETIATLRDAFVAIRDCCEHEGTVWFTRTPGGALQLLYGDLSKALDKLERAVLLVNHSAQKW